MTNLKYLKTVILKNFQSHKYTTIDFDERLNIILGPSDSGKTAIIRGIKWALYNEPSGDFFIKEGETEASVILIFSDNTKVERTRSKSKNLYILYKRNGEQIKFEGFGLNVPEEIVEEIGIRKIKLDSDSTNAINIAEQLEGPFLLSEKTSTRAGAIGRLIGVNIIDDALRETLKDLRNLSNNKRDTENRIIKLEDELKEYDYLEELDIRLRKGEKLNKIILDKSKKLEKIRSFAGVYRKIKEELEIIKEELMKLTGIEEINSLLQHNEKNIYDLKYYKIKKTQYNDNQTEIKTSTSVLSRLENIDSISEIVDKSNYLSTKVKRYENIKYNRDRNIKDIYKAMIIKSSLSKLPDVERALTSLNTKALTFSRLTKLSDSYKSNQNYIKLGNEFTKRFNYLEASEACYNNAINIEDKLSKLKKINKQLKALTLNTESSKKELSYSNNDIGNYLNKYKKLLTKLEVCPLCLGSIDSNKIDHIISHYN